MRLRILGCHGGESTSHFATSFLLDENLLIDAGAVSRSLTLEEQCAIDYVVISHSHLDHIHDLAFLADNVIGLRDRPIDLYCTTPTADALKAHIFNNVIWPDFTHIRNPADPLHRPILRVHRIETRTSERVGRFNLRTVPENHPVDCQAMFLTWDGGTLAYSADTGPTDELWDELNKLTDLRALIYEISFPNEMRWLADVSGHLTPAMAACELKKFELASTAPILLYHMKPGYLDVLEAQIRELGDRRLTILKPQDEFEF
jgi:ribonuclease BN (tRNA processing enzyme)